MSYCKIVNISGEILQLHLYEFQIDGEYVIPDEERNNWANNDDTIIAISNELIEIHNENGKIEGVNNQIEYLKQKKIQVELSNIKEDVVIRNRISALPDFTGKNVFIKGYRFTTTPQDNTYHEAAYNQTMMLQGISIHSDENVNYGDYIEIEMVDVDGLYFPVGTVLGKFAETIYLWSNREYERICEDAKTLFPGLYIRVRYISTGIEPVKMIIEHHLRTLS